jgi:hypothetical protein
MAAAASKIISGAAVAASAAQPAGGLAAGSLVKNQIYVTAAKMAYHGCGAVASLKRK